MNTRRSLAALACGALAVALAVALAASPVASGAPPPRPARVDLSARQTPLRDQGSRGTCTAFATCAALEAALKAKGHGDLDLSEEFVAYLGKAMWLEPQWLVAARRGPDVPENALGAAAGSTGTFLVEFLGSGFRTPLEADLPYRARGYAGLLEGHEALDDPWWKVTWNVDAWNLDPAHLPRAALTAPRTYAVTDYRWIYLGRRESDPTYAERFEEVLASGHEIVFDCAVRGGERDEIWRFDPARPATVAHAMLVVGYDRRSRDPRDHHFLVKNSWGPTTHPGGLTWIAYDFLKYGLGANYVVDVAAPAPWPEARFVGRYALSLDGKPAILALNRVPGILQKALDETRQLHADEPVLVDRRAGNLYPEASVRPVLRVNGEFAGATARLWFDPATSMLRYDERRGRTLDVRLLGLDPTVFVGTFETERGVRRPCYGRLAGRLGAGDAPRERAVGDLVGPWRLVVDGAEGSLDFGSAPDAGASGAAGGREIGLRLPSLGLDRRVRMAAREGDPTTLEVREELPAGGSLLLALSLLAREDGVLVGEARLPDRVLGAYAVR